MVGIKLQCGRPQKDEVLSLGEVGKKKKKKRLDRENLGGRLAFEQMLMDFKFRPRMSSTAVYPERKGLAGLWRVASHRLR